MNREHDISIPICWLSKRDLLDNRPDLAPQIQNLNENEMAQIAEKAGEALQETYQLAIEIVLLTYLGLDQHWTQE